MSLQAIRSCIRRLRVEKKVHTMVLMGIFVERIVLINHHGVKLAEYPASQVSFCGKSNDNKQVITVAHSIFPSLDFSFESGDISLNCREWDPK